MSDETVPCPARGLSVAGGIMVGMEDRGAEFDGVRIGRPATGALVDAGYRTLADLPDDLDELLALHGLGPKAVRLLTAARTI